MALSPFTELKLEKLSSSQLWNIVAVINNMHKFEREEEDHTDENGKMREEGKKHFLFIPNLDNNLRRNYQNEQEIHNNRSNILFGIRFSCKNDDTVNKLLYVANNLDIIDNCDIYKNNKDFTKLVNCMSLIFKLRCFLRKHSDIFTKYEARKPFMKHLYEICNAVMFIDNPHVDNLTKDLQSYTNDSYYNLFKNETVSIDQLHKLHAILNF